MLTLMLFFDITCICLIDLFVLITDRPKRLLSEQFWGFFAPDLYSLVFFYNSASSGQRIEGRIFHTQILLSFLELLRVGLGTPKVSV